MSDLTTRRDDGPFRWYDLFSRGARDWLRHNEKVRDAVRQRLPEIISGADVVGGGSRTVRVPVRLLEHYRFRLSPPDSESGAGQGQASPGDVLRPADQPGQGQDKGQGTRDGGGLQFVLELAIDDIVDWLWEELELPNLQPREGALQDEEYVREGWDRRGARSRLDRRRSMKEAIKRRQVQGDEGPAFTDDDLRFRQLVRRRTPAAQAVVCFAMDVSGSMSVRDRQLAKTFFFWVMQGLRRQYQQIETVFVAHTIEAWEFQEPEFFQVAGTGGTVASTVFEKVREIVDERYDPSRYNIYLFYASDGENTPQDRDAASAALGELAQRAAFLGYVEIAPPLGSGLETETAGLFREIAEAGAPADTFVLASADAVWDAIRTFFTEGGESAA